MLQTLLLFTSAAVFCFFGDLTIWGLYHVPLLFLSRCFFYVLLCTGISFGWLSLAGLCVLMQSFIYQGTIGTELLIMVPLSLAVYYARTIIDLTLLSEAFLVYACLLINYIIIDVGILRYSVTHVILGAAQLHFIVALFMLYLVRGSQGNRS